MWKVPGFYNEASKRKVKVRDNNNDCPFFLLIYFTFKCRSKPKFSAWAFCLK